MSNEELGIILNPVLGIGDRDILRLKFEVATIHLWTFFEIYHTDDRFTYLLKSVPDFTDLHNHPCIVERKRGYFIFKRLFNTNT